MTRGFWKLEHVSDCGLVEGLTGLLATEGRVEAGVVAHLAELDARRLHLRGGQSLFAYCQERLGMSESQAYYRINAARIARRFPVVFELFERRELHITALALISRHLTEENHAELLREVRGKTKRQILELLVERWPKSDVTSELRKLPPGAVAAGPTGTLEPLSAGMYRLQICASKELMDKLELARDLMSHRNPSGDLAVVVDRALDLLVEKLQKRRFGQTKPATGVGTSVVPVPRQRACSGESPKMAERPHPEQRGHISSETRRAIAERDGLRCTFRGENGQRCRSRAFLQFHHDHAWAKGGADTTDNLRLLCAAHNGLLAEQEFGRRVPQAS